MCSENSSTRLGLTVRPSNIRWTACIAIGDFTDLQSMTHWLVFGDCLPDIYVRYTSCKTDACQSFGKIKAGSVTWTVTSVAGRRAILIKGRCSRAISRQRAVSTWNRERGDTLVTGDRRRHHVALRQKRHFRLVPMAMTSSVNCHHYHVYLYCRDWRRLIGFVLSVSCYPLQLTIIIATLTQPIVC